MVDVKNLLIYWQFEVNIQPFWRLRVNSIPGVGEGGTPFSGLHGGGSASNELAFLSSQYTKREGKIVILVYERDTKMHCKAKEIAVKVMDIYGCQSLATEKLRALSNQPRATKSPAKNATTIGGIRKRNNFDFRYMKVGAKGLSCIKRYWGAPIPGPPPPFQVPLTVPSSCNG